jgi:carbon monoxide dehydrogenase subunit G
MLTLAGQEVFKAPADQVFVEVTDLKKLSECIPDLQSYELLDENHLKCVVRPGFSFLRMKMKVDLTVVRYAAQRTATMLADARGIGASMAVQSRLQVSERPSGSVLDWSAEVVQMTGLVATISADLVRGAADQVIRDSWAKLRRQFCE